jgi:hypothetical protein
MLGTFFTIFLARTLATAEIANPITRKMLVFMSIMQIFATLSSSLHHALSQKNDRREKRRDWACWRFEAPP